MRIVSIDPGMAHFSFCVMECDSLIPLKWTVESVPGEECRTFLPWFSERLMYMMDDVPAWDVVVVFEMQMPTNARMKKFQYYCEAYCQIHAVTFKLASPRQKFACCSSQWPLPRKTTYVQRKKHSIDVVRTMLAGSVSWLDTFEHADKKDDLADSYLQARSYIELSTKCTVPRVRTSNFE